MLALVAGLTLSVFFTPISAEASTGSSVSGTGTIATPGPWIPCSLWELDLRVTGKQSGAGPATGTFKLGCPESRTDSSPIDAIIAITETSAHVAGEVSLSDLGLIKCVDQNGNPVSHFSQHVEVQEGTAGVGAVHVFGELPAGVTSATCELPPDEATLPGGTVALLLPDLGWRSLQTGSISVML